ncbi:SPOR domain-containing protein [Erythrobacter sp. JK5]|uniref:SPOR domain-containing protein n=1 Tax=Erythrobacter sp. JK5 TaxID=2829500 RepID=UPI001BA66ED4|nr:SPOR domain-containing protein [Erythrobacter sp. JK5]QUL36670.1 SPOR domain-containing protein [Erythrobacter sp. JK5]
MTAIRTNPKARLVAAAGAAIFAATAAPVMADVKAGVDAWSEGDFTRAVGEWQGPAQRGDADALFNLAQAYRLGRGVAADVARARDLYAEAAQRGHVKAADNYGLLLFQQGKHETAMPLIRAASERGDPRAQYVMGLAHFNADFAEKDWIRAYALMTLAQSAGLPQASGALAQMDQFIPIEQRQLAQSLARDIEAEASQRRAAELAAVDLGQRPVPAAPVRESVAPVSASRVAQPVARPVPAPASPRAASRSGSWKVQLGAFGVSANADKLWARLAGHSALAGTSKLLVPAGRVTRLQAVGFASRDEAAQACDTLQRQGQPCLVAQP